MKTKSSTVVLESRLQAESSTRASLRVAVFCCLCSIPAPAADPANAPSRVENAVKESELPFLKITAQAEQRLGLKTAAVESKKVPQTRPFAATVLLPLAAADAPAGLAPLPLGAPDDFRKVAEQQAIADGVLATARAALAGADLALTRASKLAKERAGSERALDEARTQVSVANAALAAAEAHRALLGTDVATALKSSRRWVSVSVASTELAKLAGAEPVSLRVIGDAKGAPLPAKPVTAPPSAFAQSGAVDLFYEVEAAGLRPGQRVQIDIPLKDSNIDRLVLPWSAVLFDPQGGAWVYEQTAPLTFTHRRVSILRVKGPDAVLEAGPAAGAQVVSVGAAELFGAEFGGFK